MAGLLSMKIMFGSTYTDDVTGYTGKATAVANYKSGEWQVKLETIDTTGCLIERWIDLRRLSFAK